MFIMDGRGTTIVRRVPGDIRMNLGGGAPPAADFLDKLPATNRRPGQAFSTKENYRRARPVTGSFSMALCTIIIRRCFDTVINRPPLPPPTSNLISLSTMLVSGGLLYLFKHLKKGTLVSIGQRYHKTLASKNISLRPKKHNSWFLRNLCGKRKSCTDAIIKLSEELVRSQNHFAGMSNHRESENSSIASFADADSVENDRSSFNGIVDDSCERLYRRNSARLRSRRAISVGDVESCFDGSGDNANVRKSRNVCVVKRLGRRNSDYPVVDAGVSNRSQKKITRSGRVYNPL